MESGFPLSVCTKGGGGVRNAFCIRLAYHQAFIDEERELGAAKLGPLQTEREKEGWRGGHTTLFQNSNRAATVGKQGCCQASDGVRARVCAAPCLGFQLLLGRSSGMSPFAAPLLCSLKIASWSLAPRNLSPEQNNIGKLLCFLKTIFKEINLGRGIQYPPWKPVLKIIQENCKLSQEPP